MKTIEGIKGHIVLFCKGHYYTSDLVEGLKMIWAIRCGYGYVKEDDSSLRYIANELYSIVMEYSGKDALWLQKSLHERVMSWIYKDEVAIKNIIKFYCSEIANIQIKEKMANGKYKTIIKLPVLKKNVFKRILSGKGRYEDYKLIN